MGLISNLLEKIFGKRQGKERETEQTIDYLSSWQKERASRMIAAEGKIKHWVAILLKEKGQLPFSWESGNDEAFVTFEDNTNSDDDRFEDLEEYIIDRLDIPDAGEFQMNGSGTIYIEDNFAKARYSSTMKALTDFNEETEEETYSEEENDAGDIILFEI